LYKTLDRLLESLHTKRNNLIKMLVTISELIYICHFLSCVWFHIGYL